MFNRTGHKVQITSGRDSGAIGTVIDIDSDIIYVEKSEGMFKEMYDTHNIFGFDIKEVKIIEPITKIKDTVKLLAQAHDGESLPSSLEAGTESKVKKVEGEQCTLSIKGETVVIHRKFLEITKANEKKVEIKNIKINIDDIIFFRRGSKSILSRVHDKYGTTYEVETIDGERFEVSKSSILGKIPIKDMRSKVRIIDHKKRDSKKIKELMTLLKNIKSSDTRNTSGTVNEYKKALIRELKHLLGASENKKEVRISHRNYHRNINQSCLKIPSNLKREYWRFLCDRRHRNQNPQVGSYKEMLGVEYFKQGTVYTKGGTFSKLNSKLRRSDIIETSKKPFTKSKYVGIEIECFCDYTRDRLNNELAKVGLGRNIKLVNDRSIKNYGDQHPIEVTMLATEKNIHSVLKKTLEVLARANAGVNATCGLHVHLDMRNRNVKTSYRNLYNAQDMLFKTVDCTRKGNQYCNKIEHGDFNKASKPTSKRNVHYDAISSQAYMKHKSLEVRMHEGTLDLEKISNWVNILISIVEAKKISKASIPKDFVSQLKGVSDKDKEYFEARLTA